VHELWLVARHEYRQKVETRSFLLTALSLPLLMMVLVAVAIVVTSASARTVTIGYVDRAGIIVNTEFPTTAGEKPPIQVRAFPDGATARTALERREIQAYYVLAPDYPQTHGAELYYWDASPDATVQRSFGQFMRANLAAGLPADIRQRLIAGPQVTLRSADGARSVGPGEGLNLAVPFIVAMLFVIVVMTSASYMLQMVADEKENRSIEMLVTSIGPNQLIGGKALGLMGVLLTQIGIWLLAIVLALVVGARFFEPMRSVRIPWGTLLVIGLYFIPAYALVTGLMAAIGSAVTEARQGQQIAGLINLVFMLPLFLSAMVFTAPDSPLMVALTLFPPTAFITVSLRWGLSAIPAWQMVLSWLLVLASAVFCVWAAARVFRAGMLRYGQALSLREAWAACSGALGRGAR
jgi:ABC-2 type transport system permease protein